MAPFRTIVISLTALTFSKVTAYSSSNRDAAIKVNIEAFDFAATLITHGHFVADKKGAWSSDHSTKSQENDFLRDRGFQEYAKWYLAVDRRHSANSKARYKFPFGDFRNVHRCGLLAIKARAHEYRYQEIENAAAKLLERIESALPRGQKRID